MRLQECNLCGLCKSRLHSSVGKLNKPSNVLVVFGREPKTKRIRFLQRDYLSILSDKLDGDISYTYAIRCQTPKRIRPDHIVSCRVWLKSVVKSVKPYLIILVGPIAVHSVLGEKYKVIPAGVFYDKMSPNNKKRKFFVSAKLSSEVYNVEKDLDRLQLYIKECYG